MLFLIFVYYLAQGAAIDANPVPSIYNQSTKPNSCKDITHCRTIWNIIWSCLITIFSCTWVAVHPNVPCPRKRQANSCVERWITNPFRSFAEHRLPLFVCALLVPEYVLAWAIRQYLSARKIAKNNKGRRWSQIHGFFIIMGGFHLFKRSSEEMSDVKSMSYEDDTPLHPLSAGNLNGDDTTIDIDFSSFTVPTEVEIKDKGKSDWLAKSLVLLQTSWFVMQCIARAIEHLPVTHLEIVTLAYAAMNFVIYIFWWNKPLNVNRPVRVFRKSDSREMQPQAEASELTWETISKCLETIFGYIAGIQDDYVNLSREDRVPRFWANSHNGQAGIADAIVLGVGTCFGAIHCIAWDFYFSTYIEILFWRTSSVVITAVPVYIPLMIVLAAFPESETVAYLAPFFGGILYVLARAVTLALAFTSLRELPPGAFDTVYWTTFIPHV